MKLIKILNEIRPKDYDVEVIRSSPKSKNRSSNFMQMMQAPEKQKSFVKDKDYDEGKKFGEMYKDTAGNGDLKKKAENFLNNFMGNRNDNFKKGFLDSINDIME